MATESPIGIEYANMTYNDWRVNQLVNKMDNRQNKKLSITWFELRVYGSQQLSNRWRGGLTS